MLNTEESNAVRGWLLQMLAYFISTGSATNEELLDSGLSLEL